MRGPRRPRRGRKHGRGFDVGIGPLDDSDDDGDGDANKEEEDFDVGIGPPDDSDDDGDEAKDGAGEEMAMRLVKKTGMGPAQAMRTRLAARGRGRDLQRR